MRCSTWLTRPSSARSQLTIQHTRPRPVLGVPAILSGIPTPGPQRQKRPFSRGIASLGAPQTGFRCADGAPGPATRGYGDRPRLSSGNRDRVPSGSRGAEPGQGPRPHRGSRSAPRSRCQPGSAGGGGWLPGEAFPAAELLKPEALLQREGLAAHLPAQFVELLPFLGGDCPLDGLAPLWLGFGHRPVQPSRPPRNPHLLQKGSGSDEETQCGEQ